MIHKVVFVMCGLLVLVSAAVAAPVASNVVAAQRADSTLVDLSYDLSGADAFGAIIAVELSDDSGATYSAAPPSLSGDLGSGIANGTGKQIVWDAGADQPNFASATMRFRLQVQVPGFPVPSEADQYSLIAAGSFTMGDGFDEGSGTERPVHSVNVSGFYMGKHEVSWSQWQEVRDWAVSNGYSDLSGVGSGVAGTHPVQTVSWYEVVKWCNAASERAGLPPVYRVSNGGAVYRTGELAPYIDYTQQGYRLPTEAEWEKAARGGSSGKRFPWGDLISHDNANYVASTSYSYDSSSGGYHPSYNYGGFPYTSPVGSFAANGYGLYDMSGNVYEWCNDWYGSSYYSSSLGSDPAGPTTGTYRVLRGGSWNYIAIICRVAYRLSFNPASRLNYFGFRLVLSE
jgi:formylglycine-generating enzyme required for sulfatase activity